MRSAYALSVGLFLVPFAMAGAQRADSTAARADSLRHQIEERFASKAQERLGLTDEQTAKLRATNQQFSPRRRELRARGQQLREALDAQLRPGVAANQDSVAKLTDAMIQLSMSEAQVARDEMKEQSKYLNPVQRAQLYVMRERFVNRLREVHWHRGEMGHGRGHWREMKEHPGERSRERRRVPQESGGM